MADSARLAADLFFRAVADEKWDVAAAMTDTTPMDDASADCSPMVMQLRLRPDGWRILPARTLLRRQNVSIGGLICNTTRRRRPPG